MSYLTRLYPYDKRKVEDEVANIRADGPTSDASVFWLICFLTNGECASRTAKKKKENKTEIKLTFDEFTDACTNIYLKWRRKLANIEKYDREPLLDYVGYLYRVCRLWFYDEMRRIKAERKEEIEKTNGSGKVIPLTDGMAEVIPDESAAMYEEETFTVTINGEDKEITKADFSREACRILGEKQTNLDRKNYKQRLRWAGYQLEGEVGKERLIHSPLTENELLTEYERLQTPEKLHMNEQRRLRRLNEVTALLNKIKKEKDDEKGYHQISIYDDSTKVTITVKRGRKKGYINQDPSTAGC